MKLTRLSLTKKFTLTNNVQVAQDTLIITTRRNLLTNIYTEYNKLKSFLNKVLPHKKDSNLAFLIKDVFETQLLQYYIILIKFNFLACPDITSTCFA